MFSKFTQTTLSFLSIIVLMLPVTGFANTAPVITGHPDTRVNLGQQYFFHPATSGANNDLLRFVIRHKPSWLSFNSSTGELAGRPASTDVGLYRNIVIIAKVGTEQSQLPAFSIEVVNPAPVISGTPTTAVYANQPFRFLPDASDPNGDELTYSITNKPGWMSFNRHTGELRGTYNANRTRNFRDIIISVSDGTSTVSLPAFSVAVIAGETSVDCTASIQTGTFFHCQLPTEGIREFKIIEPPRGMSIQAKTGIVEWTPTADQIGKHYVGVVTRGAQVRKWIVNVDVAYGAEDPEGLYIAPDGKSDNPGTAQKPFADFRDACNAIETATKSRPRPHTIYMRGGLYTNPGYGTGNKNNPSLPFINCSGTADQYITIQPLGNEQVKIAFDSFYGIRINGNYINLKGVEVEGPAQSISYEGALADWWTGSDLYNGNGIVIRGHHVNVHNNIVHDTSGSAIFINAAGDYSNITDNIIYNAAWWSSKGTTAIGIISAVSSDGSVTDNIKAERNLVFASESRIFSRVPSKGFAELAIDEGSGSLIQANNGSYIGGYLIKDSFYLYNGKGIAIARTNNITLQNNTLYMNGSTINGRSAGLRVNSGNNINILSNAVVVADNKLAYSANKEGISSFITSNDNYMVDADKQQTLPPGNHKVTAIFNDPAALDFSLLGDIPENVGAPVFVLAALKTKADKYGITIAPSNWIMDYEGQTRAIVESAMEGSTYDWSHWPEKVIITFPEGREFGGYHTFELRIRTPYVR